jgi:hypothetical protein
VSPMGGAPVAKHASCGTHRSPPMRQLDSGCGLA